MKPIKFHKLSETLYGATIIKTRTDVHEKKFQAVEMVRALYDEADRGWRIDFRGLIGSALLPWEAINSIRYASLNAAKKAIREYARS